MKITTAIQNHLADSGRCTLQELLKETQEQCPVNVDHLLPQVIAAIAELTASGLIQGYEQKGLFIPEEYAWELTEAGQAAHAAAQALQTPRLFADGLEFQYEGKEAMVWSGQQRKSRYSGKDWVYMVVLGWKTLTVMTEAQIEQAIDPVDIYADNHRRWDGD